MPEEEYALHEKEGWVRTVAAFPQERAVDGSAVTLRGICCRCEHDMSVELPIERRTRRKVSPEETPQSLGQDKFIKVAFCNCGWKHANRPEGRYGCGAYGALMVGE